MCVCVCVCVCIRWIQFFYSVKLEKENKENKFYKFIWFRGEENNIFGFNKV